MTAARAERQCSGQALQDRRQEQAQEVDQEQAQEVDQDAPDPIPYPQVPTLQMPDWIGMVLLEFSFWIL